jgi:Ca-activated chloride channel family protein
MRTSSVAAALFLFPVCCGPVVSAAGPGQDPSVSPSGSAAPQSLFRSASSELVTLPVTVVDKGGRLVSDLAPDQFTVYDNGRRQPIVFFSNADTPVSVAIVIDDSGSMRRKMGQVIAATLAFARSSHPDDELFVIEFNERVRDTLDGRPLSAADASELHAALSTLDPAGQTALYDAVLDGFDHLDQGARRRRVLVLISDGGDNASAATFDQVLDRARRSNVTIYTIGLFDEGAPDTNPGVLKKLAEATGGERFLPRSPGLLIQACEQIAREIRSGYILAYEPPARDGAYHRLRVQIAGADRGLAIRTRPGYFAAAGTTP